jgi:hypothetical protein
MSSVAVPGRNLVQPISDVEAPRSGKFVVINQIDVSPKRHDGQPCCKKVSDEAPNFVLIHLCHGDLCYSSLVSVQPVRRLLCPQITYEREIKRDVQRSVGDRSFN